MLELREQEILAMLEKLKDLDFVLIGVYAVNAYTQPRFSVDCDLVVKNTSQAGKIKSVLSKEGYKEKKINPDTPYIGEFLCLSKKVDGFAIPFDIMIGSVIDRDTKLKFPAEWIFNNSKRSMLTGKVSISKIELMIASPDRQIAVE